MRAVAVEAGQLVGATSKLHHKNDTSFTSRDRIHPGLSVPQVWAGFQGCRVVGAGSWVGCVTAAAF